MKIAEVIALVNDIKPNAFSQNVQIAWLSQCDGMVQTEIWLVAKEDVVCYTGETGTETVLLADPPHDKIYQAYLLAMIDFANGEYEMYQNTMQVFNQWFREYQRWYAQRYRPADLRSEPWRGHYYTAYGVAVKHGYRGTEEEWLASLTGPQGAPGEVGPQGIQGEPGFSPFIESENYPGCYYRTVDGEEEWLNPPMVPNTTYRTANRHTNHPIIEGYNTPSVTKPVYVCRAYIGALPKNSTARISIPVSGATVQNVVSLNGIAMMDYEYLFWDILDSRICVSEMQFDVDYNAIEITTTADMSTYFGYATIEFTKK